MMPKKTKQIEKIFGGLFEQQNESLEETIKKIKSYEAKYDPKSDLTAFDQLQICEVIDKETPVRENLPPIDIVKVKGNKVKVSYLDDPKNVTYEKNLTFEKLSKENRSFCLAGELDDLGNLAYYEKLVRERRADFLRNCLIITLNSSQKGIISLSKAKYFTGVVKCKSAQIKRIRACEERNKR